tara:strand:- start:286 stop:1059 length:774 start_codon:yes stop_codon:yes gene_type:complete
MIKKNKLNFLSKNGYLILENVFTKDQTNVYKKKLEHALNKRIKKKQVVGSHDNQVMYNYFVDDKSLLELIYIPKIHKILEKILEPNYVLQCSSAQNRIISRIDKKINLKKKFTIGKSWHTDSRYLNNKRLCKGFSYLVIIALDEFNSLNGPTQFVEKSINILSKPKRILNLKFKELIMKQGSVCIMDTGMWHRAGKSTNNSRWSIFSIYTGWFVKPYYNYYKFIEKNKLDKKYKKLLHYYSKPPEINEFRNTVTIVK